MTTVSVHDRLSHRQAHNLPVEVLSEAVRPWFGQWQESVHVRHAIEDLRYEETREAAARFLGLELIAVA
ncbi:MULTISPECIES: hypothetical protein [unclassified Schaalia]|uniref:hypothetical protein n=1 Tax=unclassified Schaalia TaxID=2691889 RepID=UPI002F2B69AB